MSEEKLRTVEECKKIAAEILGVDEKDLFQVCDGVYYGFRSGKDPSLRDVVIDPRKGKEVVFLPCQ